MVGAKKNVEFEKAVGKAGFGKYNLLIVLAAGMTAFLINSESYSIGYVLSQAAAEFKLDVNQRGWLTSVGFIGIISTSHFWGILADTKGRRIVIICCMFGSFCTTVLSTLAAMEIWSFLILRTLNGICLSGSIVSVYAYLGEFHGNEHRSRSIAYANMITAVAFILMPVLAYFIVNSRPEMHVIFVTYTTWRMYMLICGIPAIFIAVVFIYLPQSPKFLLHKRRKHESLKVLSKMYSMNTGNPMSSYSVESLASSGGPSQTGGSSYWLALSKNSAALFRMPHLVNVCFVSFLQFVLFVVSSGLLLWYPQIASCVSSYAKQNSGREATICESLEWASNHNNSEAIHKELPVNEKIGFDVFVQNTAIGVAYFVGLGFIAFCIGAVGKTVLFVSCLAMSGISSICLYFAIIPQIITSLFIVLLVVSGLCVTIVTAFVVEIFPTHINALALSFSFMVGRLGSIVASTVMGTLLNRYCSATFLFFGALLFVCGFLVIGMHIRTANSSRKKVDLP